MEKINELTSENIVQQNIERLKEIFPTAFSEGKLVVEELQALVGEYIQEDKEFYQMTWAGKTEAQREANKVSTGTLRPSREESKDWDSTGNIFIEGDNLEVLKLLQKSYSNKIKMIYIDPPYNTGKDFVYKDNYKDNLNNYLELTGQTDEHGRKFSTNTDSDGRYHSNWLNMMYPRLKLARNLLTDDGVIFISIGENEVFNLQHLCNSLFGEENFIGNAGRISKKANNQGDFWAPNFDYVLTYAKNINYTRPFFGGINYDSYKEIETDGARVGDAYQLVRLYMSSLDPMRGCSNQRYFIECPDGTFVIPPGNILPETLEDGAFIEPQTNKDKVWRWSYKSYLEKKDQIVIKQVKSSNLIDQHGNPAKWNVFTKTYLKDVIEKSSASPNNFLEDHINQKATQELNTLDLPFDFPKPTSLVKHFSEISQINDDEYVIDFFSGSGTTAHAIMSLNSIDGKKRKCISVQLPEFTDEKSEAYKSGYKTVAEITKERIRRAGELIKKENKDKDGIENLDVGFRVFKLDSSNIQAWDTSVDEFEGQLDMFAENNGDHIKSNRTKEDVLFEILLKYGLELTLPIEEKVVGKSKIYNIGFGSMYICLSDQIKTDVATTIGEWHKESYDTNPSVIFKDSGFANDADKTNTVQTLRQVGIENVKSI